MLRRKQGTEQVFFVVFFVGSLSRHYLAEPVAIGTVSCGAAAVTSIRSVTGAEALSPCPAECCCWLSLLSLHRFLLIVAFLCCSSLLTLCRPFSFSFSSCRRCLSWRMEGNEQLQQYQQQPRQRQQVRRLFFSRLSLSSCCCCVSPSHLTTI